MAHLTAVNAPTDSAPGVYAFLDQPAVSSVATPLRTTTSEYDDTEATLKRHNVYPPDYPEHKKVSANQSETGGFIGTQWVPRLLVT